MEEFNNILITGGCGFVGSSLALLLKQEDISRKVISLDNLKRRGSELNISRLKDAGIEFIHGDIRVAEDLAAIGEIDLLVECSAEPSVMAGYNDSPAYAVQTNLAGTYNCLELVRNCNAALCFLSSSRVYPHRLIEKLVYTEKSTRYDLLSEQPLPGAGPRGIAENFPLDGPRSLYGATKLASELLIHEYIDMYDIKAVINRCGLIAGPGQFGKTDQGIISFWVARHFWKQPLADTGFGGSGKQVRDILHVKDLYSLIKIQLADINKYNGVIYNVGGGRENSISLLELTDMCRTISGNTIRITSETDQRPADIRLYISDNRKICSATGWRPIISPQEIITEIYSWIQENENILEGVLN